jgi:large subunit ribosomal protein L4e
MQADVYSISGTKAGSVELPGVFYEPVRKDLIRRAVLAERSSRYQPKGVYPLAGLQTTAEYKGRKEDYRSIKNKGISRLPREKLPKGRFGRVRIVPFSVKGRRAHPPKPEKVLVERINRKERAKAMRSAIAATALKEMVLARGHRAGIALPLVVENSFEEMRKTKDVLGALEALRLDGDLQRAKPKKRTGVAARRRGGYATPRSVLIVVGNDKGVLKAARNIPGVDAVLVDALSAELLAPGASAGRLTLWTQDALQRLDALFAS